MINKNNSGLLKNPEIFFFSIDRRKRRKGREGEKRAKGRGSSRRVENFEGGVEK
jgi:hypothetical protein